MFMLLSVPQQDDPFRLFHHRSLLDSPIGLYLWEDHVYLLVDSESSF